MMELHGTSLTVKRAARTIIIETVTTESTIAKLVNIGHSIGLAWAITLGDLASRTLAIDWGKRVGLLV